VDGAVTETHFHPGKKKDREYRMPAAVAAEELCLSPWPPAGRGKVPVAGKIVG
jgi:hypothetical protein